MQWALNVCTHAHTEDRKAQGSLSGRRDLTREEGIEEGDNGGDGFDQSTLYMYEKQMLFWWGGF